MTSMRIRFLSLRFLPGAGLILGAALASASAAEVVILKDGFVIQGKVSKESTTVADPASGKLVPVPKETGYDTVDEGPKWVVFSTHVRQLGAVSKDIRLRPEYKAYTTKFNGRKNDTPLPLLSALAGPQPDFDARWYRKFRVRLPDNGFDIIEEQLTYLDPYFAYMVSPTHYWRSGYRTSELDPARVRRLLSTHPLLSEPDGKPDAGKRVAVAKFMLDAGWLPIAKDDLEKIRELFPEGTPANAKESYEKLVKEVDSATTAQVIKEAEKALAAGRYNYAGEVLATFVDKLADPKQLDEATKLKAQLQTTLERYEAGRRLLRGLLDEVTGLDRARPALGVGGGLVGAVWPVKPMPSPVKELVAAGEKVYAEVHPDSIHRIDSFVSLAVQAEKQRLQGRDPTKKPEELLATVASGWAMGKNGATPDPKKALRIWSARETVLAFQRTEDLNARNKILREYRALKPVDIGELGQIISLLPPADPENLMYRTGTPVGGKNFAFMGIYKRTTKPTAEHPIGVPYYVKLPPEYHHGRAYPVIIALGSPSFDVELLVAGLSSEADRNGYIIVAPDWTNKFANGWQWSGDDHWYVTSVLREAVKTFCIDNDRVFLIGIGDGGNMALDVGLSHPDLFAGVMPIGPVLKPNLLSEYWKNAKVLPFFVVTGELAPGSAGELSKQLFDRWMRWGYPALMTIYKGRGIEWYGAEVPVMFDWMSRKKRVTATAVLRLDDRIRQDWTTMRLTDNRFYWLGIEDADNRNMLANHKSNTFVPARIQGDISGDNLIRVTTFGIKKFSVLLTSDLIDWSKPVRVSVNGSAARDYKPRVLTPDLDLLLEDYRVRGDRRVLLWNRLEFKVLGG